MVAAPDSLRSTLDTLRLDPKAREDRRYLVTLLRRLGYTEEEIERELGPAEPVEAPLAEIDPRRVVEVEYLGSGDVEEFEPVTRARNGEAAETTSFAIEEDLVEFQRLEPEAGRRLRVKVVRAADREAAVEAARSQGLNVVRTVPVHVRTDATGATVAEPLRQGASGAAWDDVQEPGWEEGEAWPEQPSSEWQTSEAEQPADEAAWEPAQESTTALPAQETAWQESDWDQAGWEDAEPGEWPAGEAIEQEPSALTGPAGDEPFRFKDYTLHTREVQLSPDRMQRIYFFAKSTPASGEPCGMPEGYEVRENDKTGLPFLARAEGA